jgi:dihydrodipicolinate reductase
MNILLIGYGKMGKLIEQKLLERGHSIAFIMDLDTRWQEVPWQEVDCAIDFSAPDCAIGNMAQCFAHHTPVVEGTTGWYSRFDEIKDKVLKDNLSLFYSSNFSVGMFIFQRINQQLAQLMNSQISYDVSISETHHIHKKDAPSGTAITLAEQILQRLERKTSWLLASEDENHSEQTLDITAIREGEVPGTHSVNYTSKVDDITIIHTAHSREGFALGAVLACEFLQGKKGLFTMKDMF